MLTDLMCVKTEEEKAKLCSECALRCQPEMWVEFVWTTGDGENARTITKRWVKIKHCCDAVRLCYKFNKNLGHDDMTIDCTGQVEFWGSKVLTRVTWFGPVMYKGKPRRIRLGKNWRNM